MNELKHRGFTLIELLVAISILALLVGILLPNLKRAREAAQRAACGANLRQLGIAMRLYLDDSNDFLPAALPYGGLPDWEEGDPFDLPDIATVLKPYLEREVGYQDGVFRCPGDLPGKTQRQGKLAGKTYYQTDGTSYAYNFRLSGRKLYDLVRNERVKRHFGGVVAEEEIWILRDMVAFHGKPGTPGAANYLYIDGHVSDLAR